MLHLSLQVLHINSEFDLLRNPSDIALSAGMGSLLRNIILPRMRSAYHLDRDLSCEISHRNWLELKQDRSREISITSNKSLISSQGYLSWEIFITSDDISSNGISLERDIISRCISLERYRHHLKQDPSLLRDLAWNKLSIESLERDIALALNRISL